MASRNSHLLPKPFQAIQKLIVSFLILPIRIYQKMISPWLPQNCRFYPTCSNYCIEALKSHGMVYGLWLGIKRICKCHPFHPGGHDPVPSRGFKLF